MADDDPNSRQQCQLPDSKLTCEDRRKSQETDRTNRCSEKLNTKVIMKQSSNESQPIYKREDYVGTENGGTNKRTNINNSRRLPSCETGRPASPQTRRLSTKNYTSTYRSSIQSQEDPTFHSFQDNTVRGTDDFQYQTDRNDTRTVTEDPVIFEDTNFQTAQDQDYCVSDDAVSLRLGSVASECQYDDPHSTRFSKDWATQNLRDSFEHKLISKIQETAKDVCESSCECVHNERIRLAQQKAKWYKLAAIALTLVFLLLLVIIYKMGVANGVYYEKIFGYGPCYNGFWSISNCEVAY